MFEPHDLTIGRGGGDFQLGGQGTINHQRVIAHGFEGRWDIFENALAVVIHFGSFAVHETRRPADAAAERCPQALVAQADP